MNYSEEFPLSTAVTLEKPKSVVEKLVSLRVTGFKGTYGFLSDFSLWG